MGCNYERKIMSEALVEKYVVRWKRRSGFVFLKDLHAELGIQYSVFVREAKLFDRVRAEAAAKVFKAEIGRVLVSSFGEVTSAVTAPSRSIPYEHFNEQVETAL
jgi:hypothetical protein